MKTPSLLNSKHPHLTSIWDRIWSKSVFLSKITGFESSQICVCAGVCLLYFAAIALQHLNSSLSATSVVLLVLKHNVRLCSGADTPSCWKRTQAEEELRLACAFWASVAAASRGSRCAWFFSLRETLKHKPVPLCCERWDASTGFSPSHRTINSELKT